MKGRKIMKLYLKNIGKVKQASVELNGITVIAGENNTGKSTIGRTLFALFRSFFNIDRRIEEERINSIVNILKEPFKGTVPSLYYKSLDFISIAQNIIFSKENYQKDKQLLKQDLIKFILDSINMFPNELETLLSNSDIISRIQISLNISDTDLLKLFLKKSLSAEFNGQFSNIFIEDSCEIKFCIKDKSITISIENNDIVTIENPNALSLSNEAIYMDDPFVMDDIQFLDYVSLTRATPKYFDHSSHLKSKLFSLEQNSNAIEEIIANNKFQSIYNKISSVCEGDFVWNNVSGFFGYKKQNTNKILTNKNLSTGLKTFVILKTLLKNGSMKQDSMLILDEPEIHLHPKWQLLFAELIVLLHKELDMYILLNTHSPYFLDAIETYTEKYGVQEKCKYYLADSDEDFASIIDVTDNTELIYDKLATPLQQLENERYSYD